MSLIYNKIARKKPGSNPPQIKYYVTPKTIKLLTLRDIATRVAKNTTMSPQEVELVLNSMVDEMQLVLLSGYSVRLGDWASMHVTVTSEGADTAKLCTPDLVKRVNVRTEFSKEFRGKMNDVDWVAAEDIHTTDPKS